MDLVRHALESARVELTASVVQHSFLKRCRQGTIPMPVLKQFLVQQGHYSRHFVRYLCALMSNLKSTDQIQALAENLFEELGLTSDSPTPHSVIYKSMLERFDLSLETGPAPSPGTLALIGTMSDHCHNPNPAMGLGALCLGAEALVAPVYADIMAGFASHGIGGQDMDFFRMHIECDDGHADTLCDIMVLTAEQDLAQLDIMIAAGGALARARMDFFSAIEAAHHQDKSVLDAA
ncbi:TenA family transcriptional regulator [Roseateles koreensis]|uniref:Iron-containing redox enzyme family protein n=1 Tax=Roseateles koreensis TaxID=2987526 RepID=A0ABT5KRN8_9BURK|nr:iron-containing redox enzyme family protein [Roseateles koreensis]MDC8784536.1 iron-containing redox enzyme family protein [Roseateles koreensis]